MTPSKTTDDAFPKATEYEKRVASVKRAMLKEARKSDREGLKWNHSDVSDHLERVGYGTTSEEVHGIMFDLGMEGDFTDWFDGTVQTGTHWLQFHS